VLAQYAADRTKGFRGKLWNSLGIATPALHANAIPPLITISGPTGRLLPARRSGPACPPMSANNG